MNWRIQIKLPNGSNVNSPDLLAGVRSFSGGIKYPDNEAVDVWLRSGVLLQTPGINFERPAGDPTLKEQLLAVSSQIPPSCEVRC